MSDSTETSLLGKVFDWIKLRLTWDNELASMSRSELAHLAKDIGLNEPDLREILPSIADHTLPIDQMMQARDLDPIAVRHAFGSIVRDMEVTCAGCRESGVCRRELEAGTADACCQEFCRNAAAVDDLLEIQE